MWNKQVFFLNNEMDDFSLKPGYPNMYGLLGGEAIQFGGLVKELFEFNDNQPSLKK